jgi:hypothetical protein
MAASGVAYATWPAEVKGPERPPRDLGAPATYHRALDDAPPGMPLRAMLSWLLRSMNPAVGPNGPAAIPFFAAWPGAPVCWARGLERPAKP